MKTLKINLVPVQEFKDQLTVNLIEKIFDDLLNDDLNPYEYPISQENTKIRLYEDLIFMIQNSDYSDNYLYNKPNELIERILFINNVNPDRIIQCLTENLNKLHKDIRIAFMDEPKKTIELNSCLIKVCHKWTHRMEYSCKKRIYEYERDGVIVKQISKEKALLEYKNGNNHIWVVRSEYGDYECNFYMDNYQESPYKIVNLVKSYYGLDTHCPYMDIRPSLMKNWINWSEDRKYSTK